MTKFKSWQSFRQFEQKVKSQRRYIFDSEIESFLAAVLESSKERKQTIKRKSYLWRAQLGHAWRSMEYEDETEETIAVEIECALPEARMFPLKNQASEGRANPKGISYLYLATDKETAMAEVRPWIGSLISVGQFETKKDINLVNCGSHIKLMQFIKSPQKYDDIEKAVWSHISVAFSQPMERNDYTAEYAPTQILAELFRESGYDGLLYKSRLGEGYNITLFDLGVTCLRNCSLYSLEKIDFKFTMKDVPYYVDYKKK